MTARCCLKTEEGCSVPWYMLKRKDLFCPKAAFCPHHPSEEGLKHFLSEYIWDEWCVYFGGWHEDTGFLMWLQSLLAACLYWFLLESRWFTRFDSRFWPLSNLQHHTHRNQFSFERSVCCRDLEKQQVLQSFAWAVVGKWVTLSGLLGGGFSVWGMRKNLCKISYKSSGSPSLTRGDC